MNAVYAREKRKNDTTHWWLVAVILLGFAIPTFYTYVYIGLKQISETRYKESITSISTPVGAVPPTIAAIYIQKATGRAAGTGYITTDGSLYTVAHVVANATIAETQVVVLGKKVTTSPLSCYLIPQSDEETTLDGVCQGSTNSTGNIVRHNISEVNFPHQVVVYDMIQSSWLPFTVQQSEVEPDSYHLDGYYLTNGPYYQSQACTGMSGSPVFLSQNGFPIQDEQGNYIAVGELFAIANYWEIPTLQGPKQCSQHALAFFQEL